MTGRAFARHETTPVPFDFAREWPFFPDEEKLRVYEPRANIAVLIGHAVMDVGGARKNDPPLAAMLERLPPSLAPSLAAVGTIATLRDGVERVVQNLITNPHVNVLFLCGEDSPVFYPLEGLVCLYEHGVDEGRHIIAANGGARAAKVFVRDALATISHQDIAVFRGRALEIVDCRGELDPAVFLAEVAERARGHVRPIDAPSWSFLDAIDVYRWKPRVLRVSRGELSAATGIRATRTPAGALLIGAAGHAIASTGKPDGRAQRALHTVLRRGVLVTTPGWESRLLELSLRAEREVLASEFPSDARRVELPVQPDPPAATDGAETATPSSIDLDPKGFFKARVLYEQGTLAADYHAADGRHVETLEGARAEDLLAAIVAGDYVGDYPGRGQHLVYLGVQFARADFALRTGLHFEEGQPLSADARRNVEHHLYAAEVVSGTSLEGTWVEGLRRLREEGLLTTTQKGRVTEGWCTFFVVPAMDRMEIPRSYPASEDHITAYAAELLAAAPEVRAQGDYTYGDRTCHYFHDQLADAGARLARNPDDVAITQRWVPEADVVSTAHHRPCLVFDLWFRHAGRLHTLQIARSHDVYGGLPQNALGIARGWGRTISATSGIPLGDLCFLSLSNNFRVGDDAANVRQAIQGGVAAAAHRPILAPVVTRCSEREVGAVLAAADIPIAATAVEQLDESPAPRDIPSILAAHPRLAERLLDYHGRVDQVAAIVERLRAEARSGGRDHTNSLVLSPRDPVADREREATPLLCMQLRRQLGRLHAAAVVLGPDGTALAPALIELQRAIARAGDQRVGGFILVRAPAPYSV